MTDHNLTLENFVYDIFSNSAGETGNSALAAQNAVCRANPPGLSLR